MEKSIEYQEAYQKAKKRVEAKIGFYIHFSIYIGVSILLIIINLTTSTDVLWSKYPIMGWGIGVLFHALGVFVFSGKSLLTEKMIRKEMEKEA